MWYKLSTSYLDRQSIAMCWHMPQHWNTSDSLLQQWNSYCKWILLLRRIEKILLLSYFSSESAERSRCAALAILLLSSLSHSYNAQSRAEFVGCKWSCCDSNEVCRACFRLISAAFKHSKRSEHSITPFERKWFNRMASMMREMLRLIISTKNDTSRKWNTQSETGKKINE